MSNISGDRRPRGLWEEQQNRQSHHGRSVVAVGLWRVGRPRARCRQPRQMKARWCEVVVAVPAADGEMMRQQIVEVKSMVQKSSLSLMDRW